MFGSVSRTLGRSGVAVDLVLRLRNACNAVIRDSLHDGINAATNGEAWLAQMEAKGATTFVDVGANVGDWAAVFVDAMPESGRGILYEPSADAADRLRHRFSEHPGVTVVQAAISDSLGEASFFEQPAAGQMSSLLREYSGTRAAERRTTVTTLDAEAQRLSLEYIDFVKVDVEGWDLHVLRGASGLLSRQRIGVLQFEYNKPWRLAGSTLSEAYSLLEGCGYSVFLLRSGGLCLLDRKRYGEYFGYSNFVAVGPARVHALERYVRFRA